MVSIAELKQHLRIEGPGEDTYLAELEAAAVQFIETQTRCYFGPVRTVSEFRRPIGDSLYLSDRPTGAVTLTRRLSATATAEEVAATEFAVRGQRLVNPNGWGSWEYHASYPAGYAPGMAPEDIRGHVRDLVALAYGARGGLQSEVGAFSVSFPNIDSIAGLKETIRAYRAQKPGFGIA